ncbi:MAG: response regulator, partial [Desulfovibrionaceae bacterium]
MAKKIMIVDDDPHIVDYLKALFEDNGYQTCTANDGEQALHVMEAERPDLVTLDLEMPNEWGPRFYRKFSQRDALKETPVIVISGLSGIHL